MRKFLASIVLWQAILVAAVSILALTGGTMSQAAVRWWQPRPIPIRPSISALTATTHSPMQSP